jgi:hypothetical protein
MSVRGEAEADMAYKRRTQVPQKPGSRLTFCGFRYILFVPPIPQQIQISVDQPYAGPAARCCGIIGTHSMYIFSCRFV